MAHLHRLIRLLAVTLITVMSLPVYADEANDAYVLSVCGELRKSPGDIFWPSKAHCPAVAGLPPTYEGYNNCYTPKSPVCNWYRVARLKTCPANQDLQQDGTCKPKTCPEGQELQPDGTCKPKDKQCTPAGEYDELRRTSYSLPGKHSSSNVCIGGCEYESSSSIATNLYTVWVIGMSTGKTCVPSSGGETLPKDDPRTKCIEKGMAYGEANGKIICVPKGDSGGGNQGGGNQGGGNQGGGNQGGGDSGGGTGGGNQGGNSGGTGGGDSGGGNGGNGSGGGGGNNKNDMENFCAKHPDLPLCKKSSYSGSGCDQPPKCEGDAVQCAIAKTVWESRCAQKKLEDENDLQKLVDANNLGGDQAIADKALNKNGDGDFDLYKEFISSQKDYFHYSGTCPQNPEFTFKGQTYKLDISVLCTLGRFIKVLIYIFSYMLVLKLFARLGD